MKSHKMVIAFRKDLDLGKGKIAAQVAHAAVACALITEKKERKIFKAWMAEGQRKVVIRVSGLDELYRLKERAEMEGFRTCLITDAGLTQIPPGTVTCLGIGPGQEEEIDRITGEFPLL
ncbi:MAG: peptidyl-tRNA hydrolase Pth2 [Candidatus Thermoplasmatota archaeon]|nr:peptidyl-tRNA hydrolase Pth2 [Candidatus Thermoplasmatota archaeon]